MTETEFNNLATQGYNRIPVVLETVRRSRYTPIGLSLKLANRPYSYLLESVQGGERFGRYSNHPACPLHPYRIRGSKVSHIRIISGGATAGNRRVEDPLSFVESYLSDFKAATYACLPRFCGGLAGYFADDAVRSIQHKLAGRC